MTTFFDSSALVKLYADETHHEVVRAVAGPIVVSTLARVEVPPDLAAALGGDARAKQAFEKLAYSHQLRHVLSVEGTKNPETRLRRIEKALAMLREGR